MRTLKDFESYLNDWNKNEITKTYPGELPPTHPSLKRVKY